MNNIGLIITIILVVGWVIKGLSAVMGNEEQGKKPTGRSLEEWEAMQAKRRAAMSEQQKSMREGRADVSQQNPTQMTMAERIELARQRARQQAGLQAQGDDQAEALRRARAQAEQKARQQREQAAQQQRAEQAARQQRAKRAQERAQRERRQAQQRAEQEAQARRQRRTKQQRRSKPKQPARATTGSRREGVVAESMKRIHEGHAHAGPKLTKLTSPTRPIGAAASIGTLDRDSLRKAFIMKELLDKPVALRNTQNDLLS